MIESTKKIIALLTDFGPKGQHYIASMKGVILNINPNVSIIDISHNISSFSIIEASYVIKTSYKYFPENTVFVIVVDPGVGSLREILAIKIKSNHYFIGPNNGIFPNVFSNDDISEIIEVKNDLYFNKPVSKTFHGRDIMAPIGTYILNGISLNDFGPKFDPKNLVKKPILYEILFKEKIIRCIIQYIDSFGNGTTNIPIKNKKIKGIDLVLEEGKKIKLKYKNKEYEGEFVSHFILGSKNSLIFIIGSTNYLEISINQGNASKEIGFKVGDIIEIVL